MKILNVCRTTGVVCVMLVGLCLSACKSVQKSVDVNKIYFNNDNVDEYPLFRGKPVEEGFYKYLYSNTVYPPIPFSKRISGRVFIEFVVERDGSVSNTKIVGGADPALEAEVLRVVNLSQDWTPGLLQGEPFPVVNTSPNWTPGKIDGKPVRMRYTLPVNFRTGSQVEKSSSKKARLSKETILLKELDILGFG